MDIRLRNQENGLRNEKTLIKKARKNEHGLKKILISKSSIYFHARFFLSHLVNSPLEYYENRNYHQKLRL